MASEKHQFVVWAPYKTGPDFAARLDAHAAAHLATLNQLVAEGIIKLAGPAFSPTADLSLPWTERKKTASVVVYEAESVESVRKIIEADVFYTGGVWDTEKLQLHPMLNLAK